MILGSWIASLSLLGALFGGLCSGLIIKHGRRKTLIYVSIPFSISWAFTLFAYCVEMIYATAFIAGFCSAIIQVSILKVHIFWEGHKILWNLHRRFVLCSASQMAGDFAKFCGLLRIYELYRTCTTFNDGLGYFFEGIFLFLYIYFFIFFLRLSDCDTYLLCT